MFPTDDEVEDLLGHMDTDGGGGVSLQVRITRILILALWSQLSPNLQILIHLLV